MKNKIILGILCLCLLIAPVTATYYSGDEIQIYKNDTCRGNKLFVELMNSTYDVVDGELTFPTCENHGTNKWLCNNANCEVNLTTDPVIENNYTFRVSEVTYQEPTPPPTNNGGSSGGGSSTGGVYVGVSSEEESVTTEVPEEEIQPEETTTEKEEPKQEQEEAQPEEQQIEPWKILLALIIILLIGGLVYYGSKYLEGKEADKDEKEEGDKDEK